MILEDIKKMEWEEIKNIYLEAFPKKERKPFNSVKKSVSKNKASLLVAHEDNTILGFIVLFIYKDYVYVDYLAVNQAIRSKGTGSKILSEVKNLFKDKEIVLLIERIEENCSNYEQRVKRKNFYLKNGFVSTSKFVSLPSSEMEILALKETLDENEFLDVMKFVLGSLFFKLSHIKFVK